jgi:hypothetical protein
MIFAFAGQTLQSVARPDNVDNYGFNITWARVNQN